MSEERTKEVTFKIGRTIYAGERTGGKYNPYESFSVEYGETWIVLPGENPSDVRSMLCEHVASEHRKMVAAVEHQIKSRL